MSVIKLSPGGAEARLGSQGCLPINPSFVPQTWLVFPLPPLHPPQKMRSGAEANQTRLFDPAQALIR